MKKVLKTGIILSAVIITFLGTIFITNNKTEIYHNNRMVYISRITGFLDQTQYLVDLKTGNEQIQIHNPIITKSIIVKYRGHCQCVTEMHKGNDYSVFLLSDGRAAHFEGTATVLKTVPYNQVRDKFEEGKKIRNQLAEKHKDIIAQAKNDS